MFRQHNNGKHFHRFLQAEPKGQRKCPKCGAGIIGATTTGRCSKLQQRDTSTAGTDEHCDHVFTKKLTKDKKKIQELEAQLAVCGGGASVQISSLQDKIAQLENKNVQLMTDNNRLRQDALNTSNFLESLDSGLNDPLSPKGGAAPSLGDRENSLDGLMERGGSPHAPSSGHNSSLEAAEKATADAELDSLLHLLDDSLSDSELYELQQENVQLKQQLDSVRQSLRQLLQKLN